MENLPFERNIYNKGSLTSTVFLLATDSTSFSAAGCSRLFEPVTVDLLVATLVFAGDVCLAIGVLMKIKKL